MSTSEDAVPKLLRRGLLWVAALTTAALAVELAAERHWTQPIQLVAWAALALIGAAIALVLVATPGRLRVARALLVAVILSAAIGVWEHVESNYDAGELDFEYADAWPSLSETSRWWLAVTKSIGPSPPLAPGALAQASVCVLLATLRHPSRHAQTDRR